MISVLKSSVKCRKPSRGSVALSVLIFAVFFEFGILAPANAYIDPGTGSYMFSVAITVLCGLGYALKTWWHSLAKAVSNLLHGNRK